jgi:hypothetical protein
MVVGVAAVTTLEMAQRLNASMGAWLGGVIFVGVAFMVVGVRR